MVTLNSIAFTERHGLAVILNNLCLNNASICNVWSLDELIEQRTLISWLYLASHLSFNSSEEVHVTGGAPGNEDLSVESSSCGHQIPRVKSRQRHYKLNRYYTIIMRNC